MVFNLTLPLVECLFDTLRQSWEEVVLHTFCIYSFYAILPEVPFSAPKSAIFSYYYLSRGLVVVNPPFTTTWHWGIQRYCFGPYLGGLFV